MEQREMCIYKITNLETGKSYIGRTVSGIKIRLHQHFADSKYPKTKNPLHYAMKLYSRESFKIEEVYKFFTDSYSYADRVELAFIKKYNTFIPNGYNVRRVKING